MTTFAKRAPVGMTETRPRGKTRTRAMAASALVVFAFVAFFLGPRSLPSSEPWIARASVMIVLVASSVSIVGWRKLAVRLGPTTAFAALAVIWGVSLALFVALIPQCPGAEDGRCSLENVVSYGAIGMLFIVSIAAFVVPPMLFGKAGSATYRWNRRRVTFKAAKLAVVANRKKNKHGISSKAHEKEGLTTGAKTTTKTVPTSTPAPPKTSPKPSTTGAPPKRTGPQAKAKLPGK